MFKNVASQKLMVFAFDATSNLPKTGDAANITAYVSKDYGAVTVLADTSATEMEATNGKGYYLFDLAQAETNADTLLFSAKSGTANIVVIGAPAVVFPVAANFSSLSVDSNGRVDVGKLLGTAWLTPGTAGTPDVNVKLWNGLTTVALPLVPTTAGRTLDVSAGGEGGLDWANVGSPTTSLALTGTTIAVTQKVDVDTIKTNPVVNAGTITFPTTATLASTTNLTAGTIATVSGNVNGSVGSVTGAVGSVGAGGISASSFGAGAIDAAAIAADAIGSSELAASAATEIANAVAALNLTEPTAVVASAPTLIAALSWLLTISRNKIEQTATTQTVRADDGTTAIAASTVSDDATTFIRGKFA